MPGELVIIVCLDCGMYVDILDCLSGYFNDFYPTGWREQGEVFKHAMGCLISFHGFPGHR